MADTALVWSTVGDVVGRDDEDDGDEGLMEEEILFKSEKSICVRCWLCSFNVEGAI